MRSEIVRWMLWFCLDGVLLRASASGFLERSGMPFLREVAVVRSRSLADTIVNPARVWFSSKFSYETLQFSNPVPKLGDFVDVWVVTDRGIIDLVDAETG
jgi:hypothetical protein